mgnify:CR=1 FL=1
MPRRLIGFNKLFTVKRRQRTITGTGSVIEADAVTVATGVPGAIQPHVLSNLPPMGESLVRAGLCVLMNIGYGLVI